MAECPKCKKKFPSVFSVSRHLNQRWSACALQHPHLVAATLPPTFVLPIPGSLSVPIETIANEAVDQNHAVYETNPFDPDPLDSGSDAMVVDSNQLLPAGLPDHPAHQPTQYFRKDFPGAGGIAIKGTSFMQQFDKESHSRERSKNPYYPFASRQEWQLGYILLTSRMSLALINEFLCLDLVHSFPDLQQPFSLDFRSKPYHSHFVPLKNCNLVPKCFHLDPNGRRNRGTQAAQPNQKSHYIIGTLLNASHRCSTLCFLLINLMSCRIDCIKQQRRSCAYMMNGCLAIMHGTCRSVLTSLISLPNLTISTRQISHPEGLYLASSCHQTKPISPS